MQNQSIVNNLHPVNQTKALVERPSYGFVNTRDVLGVFENAGWKPVDIQAAKVRKLERDGFQKHLIRLENPAFPKIEGLSDSNASRPQLVIVNSHDGTSSLQILWGLIRFACANGIIRGTAINGLRLTHSKGIVDKLPQGIDYMLGNFGNFVTELQNLQNLTLSDAAQAQLVKTLFDARLSNVQNVTHVNYDLGRVQRAEDNANDAYTVFNRVQELLMRGGIQYAYNRETKDDSGKVIDVREIATTTRRIASVASQVKLNQLAYDTALQLAA